MGELLIYGSYGYTGQLITRRAVREGLEPVVAGRRAEPVEKQATELGLDHRVFSLEHPDVIRRELGEFDAVLNCAGPFTATAEPVIAACLEVGVDYLDIAGRVDVLEATAEHDRDAEKADVTLLPAVGFDVVPSDCLAAFLEHELMSASHLVLGLDGMRTFSRGTLKSIIESLDTPGAVRRDGELHSVPVAYDTRHLDFGDGPIPAITVPWGDLAMAYYTTGIPNIATYATIPPWTLGLVKRTRSLTPVLGSTPVKRLLTGLVDAVVTGPSATDRARNEVRIWGEATDDDGNRVAARMTTPDPYSLTAETAVEAASRVLAGDVGPGFQTPASAFGADFALEFDGVTRERIDEPTADEQRVEADD